MLTNFVVELTLCKILSSTDNEDNDQIIRPMYKENSPDKILIDRDVDLIVMLMILISISYARKLVVVY